MVRGHLPMVALAARRHHGQGLDFDDLVQEGACGLVRALETFDPGRGVRFAAYASWRVNQAMQRAIDDLARTIRVPVHQAVLIRSLVVIEERLWQQLHRLPTDAELAERLGADLQAVGLLRRNAQPQEACEAYGIRPADEPLDPGPTADERLIERDRMRLLDCAVRALDPDQRRVIELRFGLRDDVERTASELAKTCKMSRERARRLLQESIMELSADRRLRAAVLEKIEARSLRGRAPAYAPKTAGPEPLAGEHDSPDVPSSQEMAPGAKHRQGERPAQPVGPSALRRRWVHALRRRGIHTVEEVRALAEWTPLVIPGVGPKAAVDIAAALSASTLRDEDPIEWLCLRQELRRTLSRSIPRASSRATAKP